MEAKAPGTLPGYPAGPLAAGRAAVEQTRGGGGLPPGVAGSRGQDPKMKQD
jgi:hypothetical protein